MTVSVTMRQALTDPALLGDVLPGDTWRLWRALLIACNGEALTVEERELFVLFTGRAREPLEIVEELWAIVGRRGGKSRAAAVLAIFHACFVDHSKVVVIGERPVVLILAQNTKQAGIVFSYLAGITESNPLLAAMIANKTAETIELTNGITIEIRAASFRGLRGATAVCVIADEAAFWYSEESGSANAAEAILDAVRPALATTGGPLIVISSPYAKQGAVYDTWSKHFGEKGDPLILVAKAASLAMNPSLPQATIDRAYTRDPALAAAEFGAEFRPDVETLFPQEVVEGTVESGTFERPPIFVADRNGFTPAYVAVAVLSSGGGTDSAAMAIAHIEGETVILDCVREIRPPFDPVAAVDEFVKTLQRYGLREVTGDRWATGFVAAAFTERHIEYRVSELTKSQIYGELVPLINSRRVELLDNRRLVAQLCSLERRTTRAGRDSIDAAQGVPEDMANAAAGAIVLAAFVEENIWAVLAARPEAEKDAKYASLLRRRAVPDHDEGRAMLDAHAAKLDMHYVAPIEPVTPLSPPAPPRELADGERFAYAPKRFKIRLGGVDRWFDKGWQVFPADSDNWWTRAHTVDVEPVAEPAPPPTEPPVGWGQAPEARPPTGEEFLKELVMIGRMNGR